MIPLYIAGCFGMLHPGSSRRAALICGPLSDEALNSYRALGFLAERLSVAGLPTLRLAYYGTGDSGGSDDEPGRFDQWLDGIHAGIAWLRQHCGAEAVTLVGHRVGASLAARAACDSDVVDSLVLLSPFSGRQLLHELTLAARISQRVWQTSHLIDDGTWFESHGLRIDHATRDALQALDLRKLPRRPAAHALLLESESRPAVQAQLQALRGAGTAATFESFPCLAGMQRDSHAAEVPHAAFEHITSWVGALPAGTAAARVPELRDDASLAVGQAHETPLRFGPDASLFGILSMPTWHAAGRPAVLLVNTSANPRWGNARIGVDIARRLASDGVASLRMDASGMGDTALQTGEVGRPYSETITRDVLHAVAELAKRTQRPVAVLGICSGGYHALQAAYRDERVGGLILVNLQRFVWREGDPPDAVRRTDLRPTRFYLRNILSGQAWYRLLRADFDVVNLVRVLLLRVLRRLVAELDPVLSLVWRGATRVGRIREAVAGLGRRGVPILYVLGGNDPGVEELAAYFGSDGARLRGQPNVTFRLLEGADHTLGAAAVRATLIRAIGDWCRDNWAQPDGTAQRAARSAEHRWRDGWTSTVARLRPLAFWHRPVRG